jgi:hypothetical protein
MENKSGTKTTEFWVTLAPVLGGLVESLKGNPETGKLLIICGTVLGCFYILSRTAIKFK